MDYRGVMEEREWQMPTLSDVLGLDKQGMAQTPHVFRPPSCFQLIYQRVQSPEAYIGELAAIDILSLTEFKLKLRAGHHRWIYWLRPRCAGGMHVMHRSPRQLP